MTKLWRQGDFSTMKANGARNTSSQKIRHVLYKTTVQPGYVNAVFRDKTEKTNLHDRVIANVSAISLCSLISTTNLLLNLFLRNVKFDYKE